MLAKKNKSNNDSIEEKPLPNNIFLTTTDNKLKANVKNKGKYKLSKKVVLKDADGIYCMRINDNKVTLSGKKKISFKLSKYKKYLKKNKTNKIIFYDKASFCYIYKIKIK